MNIKRSASRAGALLVVAIATGHWAQSSPSSSFSAGAVPEPALKQIELVAATAHPAAAASPEMARARTAQPSAPVMTEAMAQGLANAAAYGPDCQPRLNLSALPGALLDLHLHAPCHPGESVRLRHGPLVFAERLNELGQVSLTLPALEREGRVSALFSDASYVAAGAAVTGLEQQRRLVVQFIGEDSFQLHALENGAAYGLPLAQSAGQLISLGHPGALMPMRAEVYSFPMDQNLLAEAVIEAEVTEATCGREMLGETLSLSHGRITRTDLHLSMPGCEAIGDILVLKNLVPEMTLAAVN